MIGNKRVRHPLVMEMESYWLYMCHVPFKEIRLFVERPLQKATRSEQLETDAHPRNQPTNTPELPQNFVFNYLTWALAKGVGRAVEERTCGQTRPDRVFKLCVCGHLRL